ncbi:MAG: polysaccharide biosynthesis/export family protein, partial [Cyanobacteria bacterium J06649_5]
MNNGLSGSTASITHRMHRTNRVRSPFSAVQFSAVKWLASALCAIGLTSGALPVMAQAAIAQADTEAAPPLPPTAAPTTAPTATPAAEEALPDEAPPEETDPDETSSPQPIPELPPIQPTEQPPSILIDPPADPPETDDSTTDNPIDTPVRRSGATNQIPTLPPQASPRFEEPLIIPNTVVTPSDLQPAFDSYHLGPGDSIFISVQRYPDLSFQATLDLQGNVVVPLQGAVPFEGLTIAEAEELLRRVYN